MKYDILIVGGGPIGASTAYFLSQQNPNLKIGLINKNDDERAAFKNAGGCIRWFWDEDIKRQMTTETANFVKQLLNDGLDLSEIEDYYFFLYRGAYTPALNIKGASLVSYFVESAQSQGVDVIDDEVVKIDDSETGYTVRTKNNQFSAAKVLLSLGVNNEKFMPTLSVEHEKRQLFVVDTVIDESNENMPHTIVPVGESGYGFIFVKNINGVKKLVVGQEDIVEDTDETQAVDYFAELVSSDFGNIMPFLKKAKVEKILWGVDAGNKTLDVVDDGRGLIAAHCGSAVRSCVYIGKTLAKKLTD